MNIVLPRVLIKIPVALTSNQDGYEFLAKICRQSWNLQNKVIIFDFSDNNYFDPTQCSPFGALVQDLRDRKNLVGFEGMTPLIKNAFIKNGFYSICNKSHVIDNTQITEMEFKQFTINDHVGFQDYVFDKVLSKNGFPQVSVRLKKEIVIALLEIFNNAHIHGQTPYVYTSGQFLTHDAKLKFSLSDMGVTIRKNVNNFYGLGNKLTGINSIKWAVEPGNTTRSGSIPGGLGLGLIRAFLKLNTGAIQIISSNGMWEEKNGVIFGQVLSCNFLGTIVNLEFNLNDKSSYKLASEIDSKNVL